MEILEPTLASVALDEVSPSDPPCSSTEAAPSRSSVTLVEAEAEEAGSSDDGIAAAPSAEATSSTPLDNADVAKLSAEVERLRGELARRDAMSERMARESEELYELYPELDMHSLPDSVWEDVRRGVPLAAAYALAERKRFCREQKAAVCNQRNRDRSAGSLDGAGSDYFSPAEVRQMTAAEVRKNYASIMRSMPKWH